MGVPLFSHVRTCVAPSLMVALALSACGGAPEVGEPATAAATPDIKEGAVASTAEAPRAGASGAAIAEVALSRGSAQLPASPAAYDIRLLDQNGWHRETFELVPVRGAGYQTVHAVVVLRGSGTLSPVAGVQPYCATPVRCDYLPPRNGDYAERYTVSLSDDSVAQLSSTKGMIAINARHLEEQRPSVVDVTLTVDGQPPVTRRITYMNSPG